MKKRFIRVYLTLIWCAACVTAASQVGSSFHLAWFTIDGGGGASTGCPYAVSGTIGQPDAGKLTGGSYTLVGGFWSVIQDPAGLWLSIRLSGNSGAPAILRRAFQLQQTSALNGGDDLGRMSPKRPPSPTGTRKPVSLSRRATATSVAETLNTLRETVHHGMRYS